MKILVIHNRYRRRGGEDAVFETECALLEGAGHKVIRFERANDAIRDGRGGCALFFKTIWNRAAAREIRAVLRRERPDAAHFHNTFPLISPAAYWACAAEGVPVVQTVHNFRFCCLNAYLLRDGKVCEDCLGRDPWRGVLRRCYRGSFAQSFAVWAMLRAHRMLGTFRRKVGVYIALTEFCKRKLVEAGLPEGKIAVKGNASRALADEGAAPAARAAEPVALFAGRISGEKGVGVLVEAWGLCHARLPPGSRLVLIGDGPESGSMRARAAALPGVEFTGALPQAKVAEWMRRATALVCPSVCYETFSLARIEAAGAGLPVIASDLGAFASLVKHGETGLLFPPGDAPALAEALARAFASPDAMRAMGVNARREFLNGESEPGRNLARLIEIYGAAGARNIPKP